MDRRSLCASFFGFSSAVVVAVACGGTSPPPQQPLTNDTVEPGGSAAPVDTNVPAGVSDGALWTCQISDYDPQPCKFHREGGEWQLTKLLGSQRFTGVTTFAGDAAIHFVGQYFCPWGECDQAMDLQFARGDRGYAAEFGGDVLTLQWNAELAGEWGGAGYGGLTGHEK